MVLNVQVFKLFLIFFIFSDSDHIKNQIQLIFVNTLSKFDCLKIR